VYTFFASCQFDGATISVSSNSFLPPRLDHHEGLRERRLVGDGQVDDGLAAGRDDRRQTRRRAAGKKHRRLARRQVDDAHVAPEHAVAQARAQSLGAGFLGRKALGVGGGAPGPAVRPLAFDFGEAAREEALAETLQRLLDAVDVAKVEPMPTIMIAPLA
jgi:hypothetical protein